MKLSLIAILAISGCAAQIPDKPITETVTVRVPVAVPCRIAMPTAPVWEMARVSPAASLFELSKAAVIELRQRLAYQSELEAAAKACGE